MKETSAVVSPRGLPLCHSAAGELLPFGEPRLCRHPSGQPHPVHRVFLLLLLVVPQPTEACRGYRGSSTHLGTCCPAACSSARPPLADRDPDRRGAERRASGDGDADCGVSEASSKCKCDGAVTRVHASLFVFRQVKNSTLNPNAKEFLPVKGNAVSPHSSRPNRVLRADFSNTPLVLTCRNPPRTPSRLGRPRPAPRWSSQARDSQEEGPSTAAHLHTTCPTSPPSPCRDTPSRCVLCNCLGGRG